MFQNFSNCSAVTTAKVKPAIQHGYLLGSSSTIGDADAKAIAKALGLTYVAPKATMS